MEKRALLIGINEYDHVRNLAGCVADAIKLSRLLERNEDGSPNYECRLITSDNRRISRSDVRSEWQRLFSDFDGDVLFFFSGHGIPTEFGGYILTQDGSMGDPGVAMSDLVWIANQSRAHEVLIILDCCYSLYPGRSSRRGEAMVDSYLQLREGVTVLAASGPTGVAMENNDGGIFSNLVRAAIAGGAADIRGCVTSASVYGYVEQALGAWDQRTLFQCHVRRFGIIRRCRPLVSDDALRELLEFFPSEDALYQLDPSYEGLRSENAEKGAVFNKFELYRDARLLRSTSGEALATTAVQSKAVHLTPQGQLYWRLANAGRL